MVTADDNLQTFQEHISLSEHYPLEFARLLQEGEVHFEYSLYQLSKRFPFYYKCRLYGAAVEENETGPPGGPRRARTQRRVPRPGQGRDLRDAMRLVPTDAELADALRQQRTEGRGVAQVGGVLIYVLEPDPLVSTLNRRSSRWTPRTTFFRRSSQGSGGLRADGPVAAGAAQPG